MKLVVKNGEMIHGDCLEVMRSIPDGSVDMVLCDLPYGTTQNKWDTVIPFEPLWEQYWRVCKGAVVLTAAQPFTSALVMSERRRFRYSWVWTKPPSGNLNAKIMPMAGHEDVLIFGKGPLTYNPQGLRPVNKFVKSISKTENYGTQKSDGYVQTHTGYPSSVIYFSKDRDGFHPTQKPVALFEYLIRTYTNEGDIVLDNCMGSGTTAIAAENTNRRWLGIERDFTYFMKSWERIVSHG